MTAGSGLEDNRAGSILQCNFPGRQIEEIAVRTGDAAVGDDESPS